ncbi:hypothetical protein [Pseudogracilibacillus sp. SO30301A]|uniref:hypothetical protein n=1 Tax=Pseudogracilibacillus sp. SO30301A TaxID=3098291 RepID=UPI00300DC9FF
MLPNCFIYLNNGLNIYYPHLTEWNNCLAREVTIEPTFEHATSYGGILPLLDYVKKIRLTDHLEDYLNVSKQGGIFPLPEVAIALILGRVLGIERIYHF